jgi:hypothetical protein
MSKDIEQAIIDEETTPDTIEEPASEAIIIDEEHQYEDPISKEYKRDMQNWLGVQKRED